MDIGKKIEEIRNKPEHVREKYVWMAVVVCMILVFSIWLFSFKSIFMQKKETGSVTPVKELMDKSKETIGEMPSIGDLEQQMSVPTK